MSVIRRGPHDDPPLTDKQLMAQRTAWVEWYTSQKNVYASEPGGPYSCPCCGHVSLAEPSSAQAVFLGGNALRAIGVIAALEEDLGRPVLTANQVSLWYALRVAGAQVRIEDYGQLFYEPSA